MLAVDVASPRDGVYVIALRGELDFVSGAALSDALAGVVKTAPALVVVDLAELAFVDSSGVKMLLAAENAVAEKGGELTLAAPSLPVRRALEILHVGDAVSIVSDPGEALDRGAETVNGRETNGAA